MIYFVDSFIRIQKNLKQSIFQNNKKAFFYNQKWEILMFVSGRLIRQILIKAIISGLPHGQEKSVNQEKSGKTKKNDKSQEKMEVFEKKSRKFDKNLKKRQIFSVQIYKIPYFLKPSNGKKIIKNSSKSD